MTTTPTPDARRADAARLGRYGEALAARYLRERGLTVLERNWRCEHGEIDIVALDGGCLVVCEVKTRRGTGFGEPVEAVTVAKALRLRRLAAAYARDRTGAGRPACGRRRRRALPAAAAPPRLRHVVGVGS